MMRTATVKCDWCGIEVEEGEPGELLSRGWIELTMFDSMREEPRELDFCSGDCVVSYFS
jgi:hypothetical protein